MDDFTHTEELWNGRFVVLNPIFEQSTQILCILKSGGLL